MLITWLNKLMSSFRVLIPHIHTNVNRNKLHILSNVRIIARTNNCTTSNRFCYEVTEKSEKIVRKQIAMTQNNYHSINSNVMAIDGISGIPCFLISQWKICILNHSIKFKCWTWCTCSPDRKNIVFVLGVDCIRSSPSKLCDTYKN